ncbi:MAM domain-containing glycosylphosphatidylinositol anchor protein 2 [Perca fluviatilis]|nr:MAM domain-containing glycosylphosphatidylinositol anchor protein 2 [Perca fluviatilis]
MERAHSLLLSEAACSQLAEHQRPQFVFEWLTHLKKLLPVTDRVDIKQNQRRLIEQLSGVLIGSPGPPTRWLLAHCVALLYRLGDPIAASLFVDRCHDIIRSKDDSPSGLPTRLAAMACLGSLFEQLGRMLVGSFKDSLTILLKAMKSAEVSATAGLKPPEEVKCRGILKAEDHTPASQVLKQSALPSSSPDCHRWKQSRVPPVVEPGFTEIRQALGRAFSLSCRLLRAHPARLLRYEWKLGSRLLTVGQFADDRDDTSYLVKALNREGYGEYTCDITNEAGAGRCTFLVTGKAYAPEFYYDTYSALWQNKPRVYGFKLQWTQMEPNAVDRILAYRLGIRQKSQSRWWEQEIAMEGSIQKGELLTYNLTELVKPESYLVRLTPITRYGEGDTTDTTPRTAPVNPHLSKRDFEYAAPRHQIHPQQDCSTTHCSKQGFYMYIETSRPRLEGDKARLLSPTFNTNSKTSSSSSVTYCFSFYYHMYGKHIGSLHVLLRQKGQTVTDTSVWTLVGNQGDRWRQAKVNIHPAAAFQIVMEGVRGAGIEGDIAIDDVTIEEGECKDPPPNNLRSLAPPSSPHIWQLSVTLSLALIGRQR